MVNSSRFKQLTVFSVLAVLSACASTQDVAPVVQSREPAAIKIDAITKKIELHDAVKTEFKVGSLSLKKYSIEQREDRLEFRLKLESLLAHPDERMPEEAALALQEAIRLLHELDTETPAYADLVRLQETVEAYNSNFLAPVPTKMWLGKVPYEFIKRFQHAIMNRRAPEAINLTARGLDDSSRIDPKPSSFWRPGRDPSKVDMYAGFGRARPPRITTVCNYKAPKKSYGTHGGFKMDCGAEGQWKVKFGNETKTEPFNTRLFWALGYPATIIDYMPAGVRVAYDRKLLTEYNSRKHLKVSITSVLGFNYITKDIQEMWSPFEDAISGAVLKDGTTISSEKLRAKLVKSIPQAHKKDDWNKASEAKFNEDFEKDVKYLVLREASIEGPMDDDVEELGSWSWQSLDHPDRRELRAFGLVTAWVNAFDMRQNNNKTLLRKKRDGSTELVQMVSDMGSGLGKANNILHYQNGFFNDLPWDLVRLRANVGDEDGDAEDGESREETPWVSPFKFHSYSVLEANAAFSRMQLDDARWMARKLASFSEEQIQDGLIAAGLTAAETKLVLEKLLDRRQQMLDVFGLAKEFPEVMERKINRKLNYDPAKDGAPKTKNAANPVAARVTSQRLIRGELKP